MDPHKDPAPTGRPPRLLDQARDRLRTLHYSYRTEQQYLQWVRRFILFHDKRHPRTMGAPEVEATSPPLLSSDSDSRGPHKMWLCQTGCGGPFMDYCKGTHELSAGSEIGGQVSGVADTPEHDPRSQTVISLPVNEFVSTASQKTPWRRFGPQCVGWRDCLCPADQPSAWRPTDRNPSHTEPSISYW